MNQNTVDIFVTRLPLTYLNAVEAQYKFRISHKSSILIILYQDIEYVDIKHINNLLDSSLWAEIHYLPYNVPALMKEKRGIPNHPLLIPWSRLIHIYKFVETYNSILRKYNNVDRVLIGDYHIPSMRHIVNVIQPETTVILDEGFNVYRVFKKLKKMYESPSTITNLYKHVKYFIFDTLFGYRMYDLKNLDFFTSYKLKPCKNIHVISNQYEYIRKSIKLRARSNNVYFLGQSLSEIGAMEETVYLQYLSDISNYFLPKKLVYIPHRGDSGEKLERIEKEVGLMVTNLDMPIEYYLCTSDEPLPDTIAGFNSSALQNINNIFQQQMPIYAFYIKHKDMSVEKRDMYYSYFEYLKTLSSPTFSVVDLSIS